MKNKQYEGPLKGYPAGRWTMRVRLRWRSLACLLPLLVMLLTFSLLWDIQVLSTVINSTRHRTSLVYQQDGKRRLGNLTIMVDDSAAEALKQRGRVLCWIPTVATALDGAKVQAVNSTWAQRCDGHIYFVEGLTTSRSDVVSLDTPKGYRNLSAKVVIILQYLYAQHLRDYDWFLKGDDDAYVIVENLRFLLAQYDFRKPVYVGHLFKRLHKEGYMSGGASYAISREALRRMVEAGYRKNKCPTKGLYEDVDVARCLHSVGIGSFNSRDRFGRDTFHFLGPQNHIVGPIPADQLPQNRFLVVSGDDCCSQLAVSFHRVDPSLMRIMDHLLYRTSVYGRVQDVAALEGLIKPWQVPPISKRLP